MQSRRSDNIKKVWRVYLLEVNYHFLFIRTDNLLLFLISTMGQMGSLGKLILLLWKWKRIIFILVISANGHHI